MLSEIGTFADGTKLQRTITSPEDESILQKDMDNIEKWGRKWQMKFNYSKCGGIRFGTGALGPYNMGGNLLIEKEEERDLGVIIHKTLKALPKSCK